MHVRIDTLFEKFVIFFLDQSICNSVATERQKILVGQAHTYGGHNLHPPEKEPCYSCNKKTMSTLIQIQISRQN